jgi:hypothetical protein
MRRVGVLMNVAADDPESAARIAAFLKEPQQFGWSDGRNVQIDTRWALGDVDRFRQDAAESIALAPDVVNDQRAVAHSRLVDCARSSTFHAHAGRTILAPISRRDVATLGQMAGDFTKGIAAGHLDCRAIRYG